MIEKKRLPGLLDDEDSELASLFFTTSEPPALSPSSTKVVVISATVNNLWGNGYVAIK